MKIQITKIHKQSEHYEDSKFLVGKTGEFIPDKYQIRKTYTSGDFMCDSKVECYPELEIPELWFYFMGIKYKVIKE